MNDYEQRQADKAIYYKEQAAKAEQRSEAADQAARQISDNIPFGQPILVGHHSEGRARRDHARINRLTNKHFEEQKKAEYYENKAENAANPSFISSDNPDALKLLKEKLQTLEENHKKMKALPPEQRGEGYNKGAGYLLPYSAAEIRRTKERIKELEAKQAMPDIDKEINGVKIKTDKTENRLRLFFPSIPSEEMRTRLKQNGFKWSPFNQAWQRQISNAAIYAAENLLKEAQL